MNVIANSLNVNYMKKYLTVEEAAYYLHVCPATIYNYIAQKKIRVFKYGRLLRISLTDLDSFIMSYTTSMPNEEDNGGENE